MACACATTSSPPPPRSAGAPASNAQQTIPGDRCPASAFIVARGPLGSLISVVAWRLRSPTCAYRRRGHGAGWRRGPDPPVCPHRLACRAITSSRVPFQDLRCDGRKRFRDRFLSSQPLITEAFPCWPSGCESPRSPGIGMMRQPLRRSSATSARVREARQGETSSFSSTATNRRAAALGELTPPGSHDVSAGLEVPVGAVELTTSSRPSAARSRSRIPHRRCRR